MDALETKIERMLVVEIESARRLLADQISDNRLAPDEYQFQCGRREGLRDALDYLETTRQKLYGER